MEQYCVEQGFNVDLALNAFLVYKYLDAAAWNHLRIESRGIRIGRVVKIELTGDFIE